MASQNILHHVNLIVDDLPSAVAFYRDIVGLELDATPVQGFPSQFFKMANGTQIHMNELADDKPYRAHFCLVVEDFNGVFRRMKDAQVIDIKPWGKIRRLDTGAMQMFARDPAGNLVEITCPADCAIAADILADDLVDLSEENRIFRLSGSASSAQNQGRSS